MPKSNSNKPQEKKLGKSSNKEAIKKVPKGKTQDEEIKKVKTSNSKDDKLVKNSTELWSLMRSIDSTWKAREILNHQLNGIIKGDKTGKQYNVLFLWTDNLSDYELGRIYLSLQSLDNTKDTILIINSPGGSGEAAYLISKAIKDAAAPKKFIVSVPRKAKSAATLLSLGADEIHMSKIAELGPIDPQINGMPALGTKYAFEYIAGMVEKYPKASDFLASYLAKRLSPVDLGYTSRVAESAQQYAERLLDSKASKLPSNQTPIKVGEALVYEYKNHGFVIDWDEATKLLGGEIVKTGTDIVKFALMMHDYIDSAILGLSNSGFNLIMCGNVDDILIINK